MSNSCQESRLRGMNGRSLYRWILQLVREKRAVLTYTRGHSAELTVPSQMNREADHYASKSQRHLDLVPLAPVPTFTMDAFTFYRNADGWIESNMRSFIDFFLASEMAQKLAHGNRMRMLTWTHDTLPPPDYPYTRAVSAHSAVIQLYARSGQLPIAETLEARSKMESSMCRLCSEAIESAHHLFVDCSYFADWRRDAAIEVADRTGVKLTDAGIPVEDQQRILHTTAKSLFLDDPAVWPLKITQYYHGQIPSTEALITRILLPNTINRRRVSSHIASEWHTSAIRLAGRIFGSVQRTMASRVVS
ncbi:hypothetical protein C8R43DRAFT_1060343 [Mycena crocata]|nr:hypothetical protein C8R43DRAFT_1060343 [Mycena crocata]